jgi:hypothetical protein
MVPGACAVKRAETAQPFRPNHKPSETREHPRGRTPIFPTTSAAIAGAMMIVYQHDRMRGGKVIRAFRRIRKACPRT